MVYTLFVIELVSAFVLAATLLYRYGDCYRNHLIVTVSVLTAWYFSFVIMFILPLDVTSTVYQQCILNDNTTTAKVEQLLVGNATTTAAPPSSHCQQPWSNVPKSVFPNLWRVVYWTSQCLTWLIMPMMQSYSKAGDFTVKGKLKSALVDNAIYYGSYLLICGILLIYLAFQNDGIDGPKIKAIASSASNTWGLFLLILLLGYALVEVPRNLWNNSKKNYSLTYSYFKIAKLSTDKCEAEETVDEILDSLQAAQTAISTGHPLHRHVETIVQKLPIQLRDRLNSRAAPYRPAAPSFKSLINLHKKTIKALHVLQRTETQWGMMLERIFHLEDVAANLRSPDKRFQHTFHTPRPRLQRLVYPPIIEFHVLQRTETQWGMMLERIFHLEDVAANLRSPDKRFQHTFHTPRPRLQRLVYPPIIATIFPLRSSRLRRLKALHVLQRTETQWGMMLERIFHLEDVAANLRSPDKRFQHTFHTPRPRLQRLVYPPIIEWYWECFLRQYFLKTMAVVTGVMSLAIIWSEMTFFSEKPVLSIFAHIVSAATSQYNYAAILSISTIIICYMFYCAFSTVLKIRFLNLYYLAPHHQTNEYSLIFSGMMACRLTPAMCLNFLSLVHMDARFRAEQKEKIVETAYTKIMGHMEVLGIIAGGFNIYFPMLVVLLCLATHLSLGSRLLTACGFQQFVGDDDLTTDLVDEGREIVKREKRKRQRAEESLTRRRDYNNRFSNYRAARDDSGAHTGLLNDVDTDYYVSPSPDRVQEASGYQRAEVPYNRSDLTLEDEIDKRFGKSTQSSRSEFDDPRDKMTIPPRGLFDDV